MASGRDCRMISAWLSMVFNPLRMAAPPIWTTPEQYASPARKHRSMVQVRSTRSPGFMPAARNPFASLNPSRLRSWMLQQMRQGVPVVPLVKLMSATSPGETARKSSLYAASSFFPVRGSSASDSGVRGRSGTSARIRR